MRILMVGDLHCDTQAMIETVTHAADVHADVIVQAGDFGFWPRTEPGLDLGPLLAPSCPPARREGDVRMHDSPCQGEVGASGHSSPSKESMST